jgi:hypothetical protein
VDSLLTAINHLIRLRETANSTMNSGSKNANVA